jgi:predicted phage gp36 major capsid-like protein
MVYSLYTRLFFRRLLDGHGSASFVKSERRHCASNSQHDHDQEDELSAEQMARYRECEQGRRAERSDRSHQGTAGGQSQ